MAVESSSIKPSAPKKPPAVKPTVGESGQPGVSYGDTRSISVHGGKSEFSHHFTGGDGKAGQAGKEHSNEGSDSKAGKPGYK